MSKHAFIHLILLHPFSVAIVNQGIVIIALPVTLLAVEPFFESPSSTNTSAVSTLSTDKKCYKIDMFMNLEKSIATSHLAPFLYAAKARWRAIEWSTNGAG
jgi:hypothetical protein